MIFLYILILLFLLSLFLVITGLFQKEREEAELIDFPFISILIAARNEEKTIIRCLNSISELNYPKDKIEVLIGNDMSDDNTARIVSDFIKTHPEFRLINIEKKLGKALGKANVLAHLTHEAKSDYFFITDADISAGKNWVKKLLQHLLQKNIAIVSGTTVSYGSDFLSRMQGVDWSFYMGLLQGYYHLGFHATAVGNNMVIKRQAYFETGGYENIDFSVTEDFKLFKEVRKRGWNTINLMDKESLNFSLPVMSFNSLLNQRKRWVMGGMELPFVWWLIFLIYASFWPVLIILFFLNPAFALVSLLFKITFQNSILVLVENRTGFKLNFKDKFLFEFYHFAMTLISPFHFLWPGGINWKNRKYS